MKEERAIVPMGNAAREELREIARRERRTMRAVLERLIRNEYSRAGASEELHDEAA